MQFTAQDEERFAVNDQLARSVAGFQVRPGAADRRQRAPWERHVRSGQSKADGEEVCFHGSIIVLGLGICIFKFRLPTARTWWGRKDQNRLALTLRRS